MRKTLLTSLLVVALIGITAGTVWWWAGRTMNAPAGTSEQQTDPAASGIFVTTARVEERQAVQSQRFSGTITPLRQVTLVTQIGGRIESMVEEVGVEVTEGQVVAQLDVEELLLNLREREAALAQAEAYLDALKAGASAEEIRQAEANYDQAASAFQQAEETYLRAKTLYEQGVISREAFNSAQTQYNVARAQLDAAEQILAQTRRGARPEEIRAAEAQVEQARVGVEMVQKRLNDATLTAPFDGVIAYRHTDVGETIGPGSPVVTLVQLQEVILGVSVSDRWVDAFRPGESVTVTVDAFPGETLQGTVRSVAPVADPTSGLFPVRIALSNPDNRLRPGMAATVWVEVPTGPPGPAVPSEAIVRRDGRNMVFVVGPDGRIEARDVQLGTESGGWVNVTGVRVGERVVTSGHTRLQHGSLVSWTEEGM